MQYFVFAVAFTLSFLLSPDFTIAHDRAFEPEQSETINEKAQESLESYFLNLAF